jgi:hypothetical protein
MEAISNAFAFLAGLPAVLGLFVTALTIFLSSDWRLTLMALLVQYVLVGLTLTRFIQTEVAVVKIVVGLIAVLILYLTASHIQQARVLQELEKGGPQISGLRRGGIHYPWGWDAGPLGLPLRLFAVLLVALTLIRLYGVYLSPILSMAQADLSMAQANLSMAQAVSADIAVVAFWLGGMGIVGLVLTGDPLRVSSALLTVLAGFDLVYAGLEPSLALAGLFGALVLLTALAFSYLATVHGLGVGPAQAYEEVTKQ